MPTCEELEGNNCDPQLVDNYAPQLDYHLVNRIVQFSEWLDSEKNEFSPKLQLMFLVALYSCLHGHCLKKHEIKNDDPHRIEQWVEALQVKWKDDPQFTQELNELMVEWVALPETKVVNGKTYFILFPRSWTEYEGGITVHINDWAWDQLSCGHEYLPIPLCDITKHIIAIANKYTLAIPPRLKRISCKDTITRPGGDQILLVIRALDAIISALESKLPNTPMYLNTHSILKDLEDLKDTIKDLQNMLGMIGKIRDLLKGEFKPDVVKFTTPIRSRVPDKIDRCCNRYRALAEYGRTKSLPNSTLSEFSKYWEKRSNPI